MTVSAGEARHFARRLGSDAALVLPADTHEDESISAVPGLSQHTATQLYIYNHRTCSHLPELLSSCAWPILADFGRKYKPPSIDLPQIYECSAAEHAEHMEKPPQCIRTLPKDPGITPLPSPTHR
jgi:hypothetical protein